MRDFFFALTRNAVSRAGTALATASSVVFVALVALELAGARPHPYLGILTYLLLPAMLVAGLLLIPVGLARDRRRARRVAAAGGPPPVLPVVDLNVGGTRRIVVSFLLLTGVNLAVIGTAAHKSAQVMDSTRFCGTTCHTVMAPEYAGHQRSVHAGVKCVACHIGPGGAWYVRAKVSGARQAVEAMLGTYARPIPAPVRHLRPASETCTECHQPARDVGETRRAIREHADDETSTPQETVLMMKVGGRHGDVVEGIHWHADPSVAIRYHSDPKREVIDTIEVRQAGRQPETFRLKASPPADSGAASAPGPGEGGWRVMDCVDCHNRVAHPSSTPEREVDEAIDRGRIDATLPFVRREAVRLLKEACSTHDAQRGDCAAGLRAFYAGKYPDLAGSRREAIAAAGAAVDELAARNLFPAMAVTWGTYPSHLGHMDSPGCFRCHDGEHVSGTGKSIPQDCDTCHVEPASS